MKSLVSVSHLTHLYDPRKTDGIKNVSFEINKGEILALIGPSGSGKTTTLKCISGKIKTSHIKFAEYVSIGLIDQQAKLQEDKTVFENLADQIQDITDSAQRENQIRTILSQLEITNEIESKIRHLSGGQKQRVILAMALVSNPTLLLLDEPFANLDKNLRELLLQDLWQIFKEKEMTVVWVTHNTEEALKYSERLVLLNYGEVQQTGTAKDLFFRPKNIFVANFFGENNILPANRINQETYELLGREIVCSHLIQQEHFLVTLRPQFLTLAHDSKLRGKLQQTYFLGSKQLLELKAGSQKIFIEVDSSLSFQIGQKIHFDFDPSHAWLLDQA